MSDTDKPEGFDEQPQDFDEIAELRVDIARITLRTANALRSINVALLSAINADNQNTLKQIEIIEEMAREIWELGAQYMGPAKYE